MIDGKGAGHLEIAFRKGALAGVLRVSVAEPASTSYPLRYSPSTLARAPNIEKFPMHRAESVGNLYIQFICRFAPHMTEFQREV